MAITIMTICLIIALYTAMSGLLYVGILMLSDRHVIPGLLIVHEATIEQQREALLLGESVGGLLYLNTVAVVSVLVGFTCQLFIK